MIRIKEIRARKGVKSKDLAEFLGVAKSTMSQYENGKRQMDYGTLVRTAQYLGVSVDEILGVEESNSVNKIKKVDFVEKEKSLSSEEVLEEKIKMLRSMLAVMSEEDRKKVLQYANALFQKMI